MQKPSDPFRGSGTTIKGVRAFWGRSTFWIIDIGCNTRLDFPRLPGPVFDPPRRETAGRVTNWPCLWRNWRSFGGGMRAGTFSRTAAVNRAKCTSKLFIGRVFFNPYPTKWVPMRPKERVSIYHSSHGWTTCLKIIFKVFVLRYNPAKWLEISFLDYMWIQKWQA